MAQLQFRSIWISDLHLGSKKLQAKQLLDFLLQTKSEFLYLVGDIFDLLQAQKKWHWPMINDQIVQAVIEKAKEGTQVYYIPGNHDHVLRKFHGSIINNISLMNSVVHRTFDGYCYLVMHGDTFDPVIRYSPRLPYHGNTAWCIQRGINRIKKMCRRIGGNDNRSLSAWLKDQMQISTHFLGSFEERVIREATRHKVDGLICGHIHRAGIRKIDNIMYHNSGDWVESCTALAENHAGKLGIVEWNRPKPVQKSIAVRNFASLHGNRDAWHPQSKSSLPR